LFLNIISIPMINLLSFVLYTIVDYRLVMLNSNWKGFFFALIKSKAKHTALFG